MAWNFPGHTRDIGEQRIRTITRVSTMACLGAAVGLTAFVGHEYQGKAAATTPPATTIVPGSSVVPSTSTTVPGNGATSGGSTSPTVTAPRVTSPPVTAPPVTSPPTTTGGS